MLSPATRLSLLSAVVFLCPAIYIPFWPVFLTSRGFDPMLIGLAMAIGNGVRGVVMPLVGAAADRHGRMFLPMALTTIAVVITLGLFSWVYGVVALLILSGIMNAAWGPIVPLSDVWILRVAKHDPSVTYGAVRLWGSIAFLVTGPVAGWWLTGRDPDWIVWLCVATVALILPIAWLQPDPPSQPRQIALRATAQLIRHPPLAWMFVTCGLAQGTHMMLYGFSTLMWVERGFSAAWIGGFWAVGVLAEILLFWRGRALMTRLGPARLLQIAGVAGIVRWLLLPLATDPIAIVALQLLHAFTFGAAHVAAIEVLRLTAPPDRAATAGTLYAALPISIGGGLVALASGHLYGAFGPEAFWAMAAMSLATALVARFGLARTTLAPPTV